MDKIWKFLKQNGLTDQGAAALMGNLYIESRLNSKNLQDSYSNSFKMSDEEYTKAVDNGTYKNFIHDSAGYGIAQWTYYSRKQNLYNYIKSKNKSIGDLNSQLEFLLKELKEDYYNLYKKLISSTNLNDLSDCVMLEYERPNDTSSQEKLKRQQSSQNFYNKFKGGNKMKYSNSNPPLVCMMTNSTCYKGTSTMVPRGVLWHSTGAPNKTLKRYVQPSKNDVNYNSLINQIGKNTNGNDWNSIYIEAGSNAWIGTLANGTITSVQTMPWNFKPWGCGGGCNNSWIQFEICEDYLNDKNYFNEVYKEACELTAYLCVKYNIDPKGYVSYNGKKVPTILCHADSYDYGLGTNHGDVMHWFPKFGKDMNDVRNDVAALISGSSIETAPGTVETLLSNGSYGEPVKELQEDLIALGYSCGIYGADGDFGNDTETAVRNFQKASGIEVDGIAGPDTMAAIEKALNSKGNEMYRVRKSWNNILSQKGAFTILNNAINACNKAGSDYKVFNKSGIQVYPTTIVDTPSAPTTTYTDVMIGHASQDERGKYNSGVAGDGTGKEVCIRTWYNSNWNLVLRPKDDKIAEKIAVAAEQACNNKNIGYDQYQRNTLYIEAKKTGLDLSKITTPCECDCSSLVSICCICAGLPESAFYIGGNMRTTFNLKEACASTGAFEILSDSKYYAQKNYLKRGDILLNESMHTAIVLADGKNVEKNSQIIGSAQPFSPYIVRITAPTLNVRGGPSEDYSITTTVRKKEAYTIVEEEGGWGKLKSGVGWINLSYTERI